MSKSHALFSLKAEPKARRDRVVPRSQNCPDHTPSEVPCPVKYIALRYVSLSDLTSLVCHPESRHTGGSRRIAGLVEGSLSLLRSALIWTFLWLQGARSVVPSQMTGRCLTNQDLTAWDAREHYRPYEIP